MARQDCTAGVAAAELPLGLQHSPCGAQEGVVVDRLAVAAELPGSRQRRHSRDDDGDGKASREKQVRFRVDGDRVVDPKVVDGLRHALTTRHAVLAAAAGVRDVKASGGLNVEGLELSADQQRLWIGFRSPLHDGRALIACVENPAAVFQSDVHRGWRVRGVRRRRRAHHGRQRRRKQEIRMACQRSSAGPGPTADRNSTGPQQGCSRSPAEGSRNREPASCVRWLTIGQCRRGRLSSTPRSIRRC